MSLVASSILRSSAALRRPVARSLMSQLQSRASSSKPFTVVPGGPILEGDVNEPTTYPPPSRVHGSYHWMFERLLSASLVPITAAAAVTTGSNYPMIDALLGLALVIHSHLGFEQIRIDYLRPRKFPVLGHFMKWTLRFATAGATYGVFAFNTNDIGLCELISRLWHA